MKALIIILALVGLSFVGLLIYGSSGSDQPKEKCRQVRTDGDGDPVVPDDWCPPSLATATRPLQARFGPGLDLPKPGKVVREISPQQDVIFDVPAVTDPDKRRTAKLTLVDGDWAIVEGPKDFRQCLCKPKLPVPPPLQAGVCGAGWQKEHAKKGWTCQSVDKVGTIPIEWMGGRLTFKKGPAARVEVK